MKALSPGSFDYLRLVVRELEQQLAAVRAAAHPRPPAPRASAAPSKESTAVPSGAPRPPPPPPLSGPTLAPGRPEPPPLRPAPGGHQPNGPLGPASFDAAARVVRTGGQGAEEPVAQQPRAQP